MKRRLAILGYHKIGPPPASGWETWYYIPEKTFDDHLALLRQDGWEVIDAGRMVRGLTDPDELPDRAALITFDDGYRSVRDAALSRLRAHGCPAVLFVPTDYIGGRNTFDAGAEPDEPICDWDDLRELERCGVSIQSHSASHPRFSDLSAGALLEELARSKRILEDGLHRPIELFAYPYGDDGTDPQFVGETMRQLGYKAAFLYGGGVIAPPALNPYQLMRVAMGPDTDLATALRSSS